MERKVIEGTVNGILVEKLDLEPGMVRDGARLSADLSADSLDYVSVIMECEKVFEIMIPDDRAYRVSTVKDLYDLVDGIVNG